MAEQRGWNEKYIISFQSKSVNFNMTEKEPFIIFYFYK